MEVLPHLVLTEIAQYLDLSDRLALRRVCKRFLEHAAFFGMGVQSIVIRRDETPLPFLAQLLEKNPIKRVTFEYCIRVSEYTLLFDAGGIVHHVSNSWKIPDGPIASMRPFEIRLMHSYVAKERIWPPLLPFADRTIFRGVANPFLCYSES